MLDRPRSKAQTIRNLIDAGYSNAMIATTVSANPQYVSDVRCDYKRNGTPQIRNAREEHTANISLRDDVWQKLLPHAKARKITVSRLAARIVRASVATIDCVDAILDDRE